MEAIVTPLIPATYVLFLILERLFPARQLPKVKGWLRRGVLSFVVTGFINALLPMAVVSAAGDRSLFHLAGLGTRLLGRASARVGAMLFGRDVGTPPVAPLRHSPEAPFTARVEA